MIPWLLGIRFIPNDRVGIVEKLWSLNGSLKEGHLIAMGDQAGYQAEILRGGCHVGYFPWLYRVHLQPLVMISESRLGYVFARDGLPLQPAQALGRTVPGNTFQNARAFLQNGGQRGRQRAIIREGVYAINTALFVVITEDRVYAGPIKEKDQSKYAVWQNQLLAVTGFRPVLIGHGGPSPSARRVIEGAELAVETEAEAEANLCAKDTVGIVTIHDGPPLPSGEIIAPEVKASEDHADHLNFQDVEAFLEAGGKRGKQLQVLTDGTYFLNRWFATVEIHPKTRIPIGFVGVVVSFHGQVGQDVSGEQFRYGVQVERGHRGVWRHILPPGKYTLNPYAQKLKRVPTFNFVLRWITGRMEAHKYDQDLKSIELITADGYEPMLPLSLVLHIDYEKAPRVIQRFGDVQRLITQTLDPILSAYFRDIAQNLNMLDLLTQRDEIQKRATQELGRRFQEYDIACIAVLIGRPESKALPGAEDPIANLFDQLRQRRLAQEQSETFVQQEEAALHLRKLNDVRAAAAKQTELTQTKLDVEISGNKGEAQRAEAEALARRDVARAQGEAKQKLLLAESEAKAKVLLAEGQSNSEKLLGKGEGARIEQRGMAEALVSLQKVRAFGDPRLFILNLLGKHFAKSRQPLVPERVMLAGNPSQDPSDGQAPGVSGLFGQLLALLVAEKGGLGIGEVPASEDDLKKLSEEMLNRYKKNAEIEKDDTQCPDPNVNGET